MKNARYVIWAALAVLVGAMAFAAAGCGGDGGGGASGGGDTTALPTKVGPGEGALNLIAWEGYTEDQWVKPFEQETGCQVNAKYGGSSDEMVTLMRQGGGGSTTWCPPPATRASGSSRAATSSP